MNLNKENIKLSLKSVKASSGKGNVVDEGEIKNVQVFGKEVDIDLEIASPALHVKKKVETDITDTLTKEYADLTVRIRTTVKHSRKATKGRPGCAKRCQEHHCNSVRKRRRWKEHGYGQSGHCHDQGRL